MATLFVNENGDFSGLTFKKIVAAAYQSTAGYTEYADLASPFYQAFTPSEAGTCIGIILPLRLSGNSNSDIVTVTLQQFSGGVWNDVTGTATTRTVQDLLGAHYATAPAFTGTAQAYFQFPTPAVITTDASTWRIKAVSVGSYQCVSWRGDGAGGVGFAVVISGTASYSSGDNLFVGEGNEVVIDQSVTLTKLVTMTNATIKWKNPPSASWTLTVTAWYLTKDSTFLYGDANTRITAAVRGTLNVTEFKISTLYDGAHDFTFEIYGDQVERKFSPLSVTANAGQADLVLDDDVSGLWTIGDEVWIYGGTTGPVGAEIKTIQSISGSTVTLTTALSSKHIPGAAVVNATYTKNGMGFKTNGISIYAIYGAVASSMKFFGVYAGVGIYANYGVYVSPNNLDVTRVKPVEIDGVILDTNGYVAITGFLNGPMAQYTGNASFKNIFGIVPSQGAFAITMYTTGQITLSDIFFWGGYVACISVSGSNIVATNLQSNAYYAAYTSARLGEVGEGTMTLMETTFNNCQFLGHIRLAGIGIDFNSCKFESASYEQVLYAGTSVNNRFLNCKFGKDIPGSASISTGAFLVQAACENCEFGDSEFIYGDTMSTNPAGSFLTSHNHNNIPDEHVTWQPEGKTHSSGNGLADTTAHTPTGFALRLEPTSSVKELEWGQKIPTGDILGLTMSVSVWIKINNLNYYAGVNGLPTLTINYDNGTELTSVALPHTSWQVLSVSFTPTTHFGQITFKVDGRTDAVGSNAYFYADDVNVAYPPGYVLSLGKLDLWVDALPLAPAISTGISANDVWAALQATDYGVGTMGELVKEIDKTTGDNQALILGS